jgi:hypothetical protein
MSFGNMPMTPVLSVPARASGDKAHQAASTAAITVSLRIMFGHLPEIACNTAAV